MEESFQEKLRNLQYDVVGMRVEVPKQIVQLHETNLKLLDERFKELENEKIAFERHKFQPRTKLIQKLTKLIKPFDHKEAIVQLNNRIDKLAEAKEYIRRYDEAQSRNDDLRF